MKQRIGPNPLTRIVAAAPVGGALILSFNGLAELARLSRIDGWLAYLWPVTLDATGVVASLIWLDQKLPADARRSARWLALISIVLSVAGNGLLHWLIDLGQRPHTFVQIGVGSVPPLVLFAMLHVLQLAYRRPASEPDQPASAPDESTSAPDQPAPAVASAAAPADPPPRALADRLALVTHVRSQPASPAAVFGAWKVHIERARQAVDRDPDIGRPALAAELGVPESQARKLLAHIKSNPTQLALTEAPAEQEPARA